MDLSLVRVLQLFLSRELKKCFDTFDFSYENFKTIWIGSKLHLIHQLCPQNWNQQSFLQIVYFSLLDLLFKANFREMDELINKMKSEIILLWNVTLIFALYSYFETQGGCNLQRIRISTTHFNFLVTTIKGVDVIKDRYNCISVIAIFRKMVTSQHFEFCCYSGPISSYFSLLPLCNNPEVLTNISQVEDLIFQQQNNSTSVLPVQTTFTTIHSIDTEKNHSSLDNNIERRLLDTIEERRLKYKQRIKTRREYLDRVKQWRESIIRKKVQKLLTLKQRGKRDKKNDRFKVDVQISSEIINPEIEDNINQEGAGLRTVSSVLSRKIPEKRKRKPIISTLNNTLNKRLKEKSDSQKPTRKKNDISLVDLTKSNNTTNNNIINTTGTSGNSQSLVDDFEEFMGLSMDQTEYVDKALDNAIARFDSDSDCPYHDSYSFDVEDNNRRDMNTGDNDVLSMLEQLEKDSSELLKTNKNLSDNEVSPNEESLLPRNVVLLLAELERESNDILNGTLYSEVEEENPPVTNQSCSSYAYRENQNEKTNDIGGKKGRKQVTKGQKISKKVTKEKSIRSGKINQKTTLKEIVSTTKGRSQKGVRKEVLEVENGVDEANELENMLRELESQTAHVLGSSLNN